MRSNPPAAVLLLFAFGCAASAPPALSALGEMEVEPAGERLVDVERGLHRLDDRGPRDVALVAVHGYASVGKEWVEPLVRWGESDAEVWFYRWSWRRCPHAAAAELATALQALAERAPHLERLVVVGHSYGGQIAALAAQLRAPPVPTEVHIVAAPLDPIPRLGALCRFEGVPRRGPAPGATWTQWRTRHEADGAFRRLERDPQAVELPALEVVELPAEWQGGRLGHNRSLTWVAERLEPTSR